MRTRVGVGAALLMAASVSTPLHAETALLTNGETFKVDAWRVEGTSVRLYLREGGEIALPVSAVGAFLPDEVSDIVPPAPPAPPAAPASATSTGPIRSLAVAAGRRHAVDPALVLAVIEVESAFRPQAVSPKGAMGLMQLMPDTAAALGVVDPFDPSANIDGGVRHLRALLDQYGGDQRLALAAYNAGSTAVDRYSGVPPYVETRDYVRRVLERRGRYP